jgi:hypothetical protein
MTFAEILVRTYGIVDPSWWNTLKTAGERIEVIIDSHVSNTSNPHTVTAAQVGNGTAQWNANKIAGVEVDDTLKADGRALKYDSASGKIVYGSAGSGGSYSTRDFTGTSITATIDGFQRHRYTGTSAQTMTAPNLTLIADGAQVLIRGTSDSNTLTIPEGLTGVTLKHGSMELGLGNTIIFDYDLGIGSLIEIGRY